MEQNKTCALLIQHCQRYPEAEIRDIFKILHQSSFGCEHNVSSLEKAIDFIKKEFEAVDSADDICTQALDGNYSRVHLSYLNKGLSAETLGKLFFLSARKESDGLTALNEKLKTFEQLILQGELPFSVEDFSSELAEWKKNEFSALHHSEAFRKAYQPAYRVISNDFIPFLPLFAKIDSMLKNGSVRLAVEGGSASGKTTLGKLLSRIYDCTVFHMDDFFLRPEQRTKERFAEIGGNVDRERFLEEVLIPMKKGKEVQYRKFDCSSLMILDPIKVSPKKLTVVEGAYSMHPELAEYYNLSVFLDISPKLQRERISKRNTPEFAERFFNEWIPLENRYFEATSIKKRCKLSVSIYR